MTRQQQVLWIFSALLAGAPAAAQAATFVETTTTPISLTTNSGSATFGFANLPTADELVSVSAGTVSSGEGTFNIAVDYSNSTSASILTEFQNSNIFNLNTVANQTFTSGTINGLTFSFTGPVGATISIPTGTQFTFRVASLPGGVPEPATWTMMIAGLGGLGGLMRLRRRRAALSMA